jgi:sentrin-specific protease 1
MLPMMLRDFRIPLAAKSLILLKLLVWKAKRKREAPQCQRCGHAFDSNRFPHTGKEHACNTSSIDVRADSCICKDYFLKRKKTVPEDIASRRHYHQCMSSCCLKVSQFVPHDSAVVTCSKPTDHADAVVLPPEPKEPYSAVVAPPAVTEPTRAIVAPPEPGPKEPVSAVDAPRKQRQSRRSWLAISELERKEADDFRNSRYTDGIDKDKDRVGAKVYRSDIHRLQRGQWLSDECINSYIELLGHDLRLHLPSNVIKFHVFNTHFYNFLTTDVKDVDRIARWSNGCGAYYEKTDLFDLDVVIIPQNLRNAHWVMSCIRVQLKIIEFYDSMFGTGEDHFKLIMDFLVLHYSQVRGGNFDRTGWKLINRRVRCLYVSAKLDRINRNIICFSQDIPRQTNGYDCGVFVCNYVECILLNNSVFSFSGSSADMDICRLRIALALKRGNLFFTPRPWVCSTDSGSTIINLYQYEK